MGTEYLELFNEAIFNLKETTGNDSIAICDELDKTICINGIIWKSHSTLTLLATQNYPFLLKYDCPLWLK